MRRKHRLNLLKWYRRNLCDIIYIATELEKYPDIKSLDIEPRYLMLDSVPVRKRKDHLYGEFEISFSKMVSTARKGYSLIEMNVTVWLKEDKVRGKFVATGCWSGGESQYLDFVIQNWLYTYFVNIMRSTDMSMFESLDFPKEVSNWYPGSEWDYLPLIKSYAGSAGALVETATTLKQVARKNVKPSILEFRSTIEAN